MLIRDPNSYEEELQGIIEAIEYERKNMSGFSYKQFVVDPSTRWRLFLAVVINFGQQATGESLLPFLVVPRFRQRFDPVPTGQGSLNSYSTIIYEKVFKNNSTVQVNSFICRSSYARH